MAKIPNFEETEAASIGDIAKIEPGAYVAKITGVDPMIDRDYCLFVYDIAEGEHKGHYSDDWGEKNPWAHRFVKSWKSQQALAFFKHFCNCVEHSNDGFKFDGDTDHLDQFIGKTFGIVLQKELYTNEQTGDDKERLIEYRIVDAQDVRDGKCKMPPIKDKREKVDGAPTAKTADPFAADDSDVPF